jgi:hypothetical protein
MQLPQRNAPPTIVKSPSNGSMPVTDTLTIVTPYAAFKFTGYQPKRGKMIMEICYPHMPVCRGLRL